MKVYFGVPSAGHPKVECLTSLVAVGRRLADATFGVYPGLLPMTREALTLQAAKDGADVLIMHDDDMAVETRAVDGLLEMLDHNPRCAIAGVIYLRQLPRLPVFMMPHPEHGEATPEFVAELVAGVHKVPSWPFQVAAIGTGFCAIRMAALGDLVKAEGSPVWRMDVQHRRNGWGLRHSTEDTDLCLRLAKLDWEVWALPQYETTHYKSSGALVWRRDEWESKKGYDMSPVQNARMVEVGGIVCMDTTPQAPQPAGPKLVATE